MWAVTDPATVLKFAGGPLLSVYGPGYARVNMSVFKNFATFHDQFVQFRTDVFNLLNSPWFAVPSYSNDGPLWRPDYKHPSGRATLPLTRAFSNSL